MSPTDSPLLPKTLYLQETLQTVLESEFSASGAQVVAVAGGVQQVTITIPTNGASFYRPIAQMLKDLSSFSFRTFIDSCGLDYSTHEGVNYQGQPEDFKSRFAVVTHLLSIEHNWRVRLKVMIPDDGFPVIDSLTPLWPAANWFEREAFDLYGIAFRDHNDLRRLLTDYGFIGHPFRKDFPLSGHVEMRFDPDTHRVIYEPISIDPRDLKPRMVREPGFAGTPYTVKTSPAPTEEKKS